MAETVEATPAQIAYGQAATLGREAERVERSAEAAIKRGDLDTWKVKSKLARALQAGKLALLEKSRALQAV